MREVESSSTVEVEVTRKPKFFMSSGCPGRARVGPALPPRRGRRSRGGGARPDPRGTPLSLRRPQGEHERL